MQPGTFERHAMDIPAKENGFRGIANGQTQKERTLCDMNDARDNYIGCSKYIYMKTSLRETRYI